jgi:protein involved in polysaccharide export with SLBB domain
MPATARRSQVRHRHRCKLVGSNLRLPCIGACLITLLAFVAAPAAAQETAPPQSGWAEGVLRPGDVIKLVIWREEDFSGEFPVAQDGSVVLPRLGRQEVTGQTPAQLRARWLKEFERYLRNPSIEITFLRRVTVLGAVREAGLKLVDPTMTVAQALAMAGGTTPDGATERIILMRDGEPIQTVSERTRIAETPLRSGDQLFVPERSWVSRNTGIVTALISGAVSVVVALLIR